MNFIELFLTAAALSMDAFAVAVCKGLAFKDFKLSRACIIGGYFGFFQAAMPLAIATSIDALAVGVMFAFMSVNVYTAALTIGLTTFAISAAGVKLGSVFGSKYDKKAERAGGLILIALGVKILIEHLFF